MSSMSREERYVWSWFMLNLFISTRGEGGRSPPSPLLRLGGGCNPYIPSEEVILRDFVHLSVHDKLVLLPQLLLSLYSGTPLIQTL